MGITKTKTPEELMERKRAYTRAYALAHKEKIKAQKHSRYMNLSEAKMKAQLAYNKAYYWNNREKELARQKAYNAIHAEHRKSKANERTRANREEIFDYYGGKCKCCGEKRFEFLQISHIDQSGVPSSKRMGGNSNMVNAIRRTWPKNIQILCANCHQAVDLYGGCPHKRHSVTPL